jgi:hypothetical protein
MLYSRKQPSARYRELVATYREMHLHGARLQGIPASQTFDGRSLKPQAARIKHLIERAGARTILDYGSGKGEHYGPKPVRIEGDGVWDGIVDYWGVDEVTCFDPAYPPFSQLPSGTFDGVICTDVLEHCPEEDIEWIVEEIFSFASRFVFASIAAYPASKSLPNGENAHCTIRPPDWWAAQFGAAADRHKPVIWEAWVYARKPDGTEGRHEIRIGSSP